MKKLVSIFLLFSIFACGLALVTACSDDEKSNTNTDTKVDYSVSIKDQYGNGVMGIEVTFRIGNKESHTATTDEKGVASVNIPKTDLKVRAVLPAQLPEGYSNGESSYVDFLEGALSSSLEVVKNEARYVFVKDSDGNPLGVLVSFACHPDCVSGEKYTGDYISVLAKQLKKAYGEDFVTVPLVMCPRGICFMTRFMNRSPEQTS